MRQGDVHALVRLLQLASPALPIGAYSYSQGLEWQIERRAIVDAASAQRWIEDVLECVIAEGDAAVLWKLLEALARGDERSFIEWSAWYVASREARELRAETLQMGGSLLALGRGLDVLDDETVARIVEAGPLPLPSA
jgi:urease accessory protein